MLQGERGKRHFISVGKNWPAKEMASRKNICRRKIIYLFLYNLVYSSLPGLESFCCVSRIQGLSDIGQQVIYILNPHTQSH